MIRILSVSKKYVIQEATNLAFGLFFQAIRTKYTGILVRIINIP
ncbi:CLUMA_CG005675, isoform A [Clunio marinus]|uniref:CLUMA_CG005675, isoform A n=1 Tax=Clunio marinus TaxID=568069 RepID=A0A1J1HXL7_9DIPT|nr:CLUMA_CG005675, isoform A [Clunio marinus]